MDIKKKINYNVKMIKNKKFNKINALLSGHCPDFKSLIYINKLNQLSRNFGFKPIILAKFYI